MLRALFPETSLDVIRVGAHFEERNMKAYRLTFEAALRVIFLQIVLGDFHQDQRDETGSYGLYHRIVQLEKISLYPTFSSKPKTRPSPVRLLPIIALDYFQRLHDCNIPPRCS